MFAQAAHGALVPARLVSDTHGLAAFAMRAQDGNLRVCLINKDFVRGARVRIDAGRSFAAASVMRLVGPSVDATSGITLGGASVDDFGRWAPVVHDESRTTAMGEMVVQLPAASAALVSLRG